PVSSVLYGSRFLTGEVGGSVTNQCFYSITPANRHDRKYWCKIAESGVCLTVISTSGYVSRGFEGRVSLRDAPRNGAFTVRVTRLQKSDAGAYRCGIGPSNAGLFVRQRLAVSEAGSGPRPVQLVLGALRGSVAVRCPPGGEPGPGGFWCKLGRGGCALVADTDGYVGKSYEGRIVVSPPESSGAFKILINDLRREDSGVYGCGTGVPSGTGGPGTVDLQVTAGRRERRRAARPQGLHQGADPVSRPAASAVPRRPRVLSGAVGGSLALRCRHDPRRSYEEKYVCRWRAGRCLLLAEAGGFVHGSYRGRVRIDSKDQENGTYTVTMSDLREDDAGWYWCGARSGHAEQTSSVKLHVQRG
ncbi:PIGR protein, partial [Casuarius casuarius]|nr:PIGR protein [Casuarius casuarius]